MQMRAFVEEKCRAGGPGPQILGQVALDAFGEDADVLAGTTETRMAGGKVQFWRLLLLTPNKLIDLFMYPLDSQGYEPRASLKISTYPLRNISQVTLSADGTINGTAFTGRGTYTVSFVPGYGIMNLELPPRQPGLSLEAADEAGYRRVAVALMKALA